MGESGEEEVMNEWGNIAVQATIMSTYMLLVVELMALRTCVWQGFAVDDHAFVIVVRPRASISLHH